MSEFGISAKLIRLCGLTLKKVGNNLSKPFDAKRGFRQGVFLSCDFFNILTERIICAAGLKHSDTIFYKSVMPLANADDVGIIGRSDREVAVAFSKFAEEVRSIGLAVNESKTKFLLSSTAKDSSIGESVEIDCYYLEVVAAHNPRRGRRWPELDVPGPSRYLDKPAVRTDNFEVVKDFIYLCSSINTDNDISLEIRRRITLANRCYFGLRKQLKKALSWKTKICLYKSLILTVLLYGVETWTLTSDDFR